MLNEFMIIPNIFNKKKLMHFLFCCWNIKDTRFMPMLPRVWYCGLPSEESAFCFYIDYLQGESLQQRKSRQKEGVMCFYSVRKWLVIVNNFAPKCSICRVKNIEILTDCAHCYWQWKLIIYFLCIPFIIQ